MPFVRMEDALVLAKLETSIPQGFRLSSSDYKVLIASLPHPDVTVVGTPAQYAFRGIGLTETTQEGGRSELHVLGQRPIFENPIPV